MVPPALFYLRGVPALWPEGKLYSSSRWSFAGMCQPENKWRTEVKAPENFNEIESMVFRAGQIGML